MFPLPTLTLIKIGAATAALLFAYWLGYSREHEKFLQFQSDVAAVGRAQEQVNRAVIAQHDTISQGIKDEYEARLSALNNYYSERVRNSNSSSGNVPSVSKPAACPDAAPANTVPAGQCAETTLQLIQLQKWIENVKK
jgi:hypothetical protein